MTLYVPSARRRLLLRAGVLRRGRGGDQMPLRTLGVVGVAAPSGTVTLLFTDVVGSTALWESAPEAMARGGRSS